jgi:DNA (cytosine-5)-methyltransferase 1
VTLTFGSLFAGIGGFDLGFERVGMTCKWQVEIDPFCQKVLAKHWPNVERYSDVRECGKHNLAPVDVICGGFPCQDISNAGLQAGIEGTRSGLWSEFYRIICELRPRYVVVENVSALLVRGMDVVLGNLASCGYDAEWNVLPASAFGSRQLRQRVFIIGTTDNVANPNCIGAGCLVGQPPAVKWWRESRKPIGADGGIWATEPELARVAYGIPNRVDRLRTLGNAVVPQVAEWIGHRMIQVDHTWQAEARKRREESS